MYTVVVEKSVIKQLQKISEHHYTAIKNALLALAYQPRPNGYLKLKGRDGYRIRVGDYRIIYEITDNQLMVLVLKIAHRKDAYQ